MRGKKGLRIKSLLVVFQAGLAFGIALLQLMLPAYGQVYVGGELTANTIYSPANNPYIVTQSLIVPNDITLTLLPGVNLLFETGTGLISSGILVAKGTPDQKISFSLRNPSSSTGFWQGIVMNNSKTEFDADSAYKSGSVLSSIVITDASYALSLDHATSILFENNLVELCSFGIYIMASGENVIRGSDFNGCDYGIFIANGYPNPRNKIYGNTIINCNDVAIFINSTATQSHHNVISGNKIKSCNIGLHVGNYSNNGPGYNEISGNWFTGNKDAVRLFQHTNAVQSNYFIRNRSGIIFWESDFNTVSLNLFSGHVLNAITLAAGSSNNTVSNNSMNFNSGGVWIKPDSLRKSLYNSFLYNTITHNADFSYQIRDTPQGPVQFNNIINNGSFSSFINLSDSLLHAEYNYWGTINTSSIDSVIRDVYDLPVLGEVLYHPILGQILTSAPVPPVDQVIKQRIGNNVVVSWPASAISDLGGYNVYSGVNDYIEFERKAQNGLSSKINLGAIAIEDSVAVTVTDTQADGLNDQTEGYESDFAYAIAYPYAGPDTAICFNSEYAIQSATALDYANVSWSTSGDGAFDDEHILNPVYSPGALDYSNQYVSLFLKAETGEDQFSDTALITFHVAPIVYSGNDTTISEDTGLWLVNAAASGDDLLKWTSTGDGTFNSDTLCNPRYIPGPVDRETGQVVLTLTGYSACGSDQDQMVLKLKPGFYIEGRIHAGAGLAINSRIDVYKVQDDGFQPLRSEIAAVDGTFNIQSLLEGSYYLYGIPDTAASPGYLPTYYFNDIRWGNAYRLELNANTFDVDIDLARKKVELPYGEGSVSGYCTSLAGNPAICGNVTVLLYDRQMKNILGWTLVRNGGDFRFRNLPFGDYVLSGEKAGSVPFHSSIFELTPSQPQLENVQLICTPSGHKFSMPEYDSPGSDGGGIVLYPNPVAEKLFISGLAATGTYSVKIINAQGPATNPLLERVAAGTYSVFLGSLSAGMYVVEIYQSGAPMFRAKFIKF